ncbi:MAG: ABC transporter ATP-binding protein/permease [Firmicutes bacterium]|nr:ABC transporter ATP-binding protein/permease [Bacillota bacterium]MDD7734806.1 ABC transporter ATP-binding protein [Bacillota bacterium]
MADTSTRRPAMRRGRGPTFEKPKDFKGTFKKLLKYLMQFKAACVVVVIAALCSTLFNVVGPKILGMATTELFAGVQHKLQGTGGIEFGIIGKILAFTLTIYLASSAFSFIQGWLMTGVSQKICFRLRADISEKIDRMPMKYFESHTVGEVLSRITNDIDTLGQGLNQSITQLITSVVTVAGIIIVMLTINPLLTVIAVLVVPLSAALMLVVMKKSQPYFKRQQSSLGEINGQIEETFSGQNVVKAFNREDAVIAEFEKTNGELYESAWKSQFLAGLMQPVMIFVGNIGYAVVAAAGAALAIRGNIKVGDIQAFVQYVKNLTQPISMLAQVSNMLQSMAAAAERVFEFLDEEEETADVADPAPIDDIKGDVEFSHVRFGYNDDKVVIKDFSSKVSAGQTVAIVGPTGAGKTTIVKLLMRFYDVNGGSIKVDGTDIRDFRRADLRKLFGMVLQDTWLFKGTIMENIRYGRLDATDEEVIAAAEAANAHHFIKTLPGGYRMELNEEASNVSQGQKQLLTIARAILADNRIMILDEATSSVDTRTETRIQQAMNRLMEGRTSFVIAHRLSTIRDADLILVMREGDIVEQGTHDELLAANGFYADLYNSQFEEAEE